MNSITSLQDAAHENRMARARKEQHESGMADGLCDFVLTSGAWVDGTSAGVSPQDIAMCFFESDDALDFERRVWAEIYKLGDKANPKPSPEQIMRILATGSPEPANAQWKPRT